MEVGGAQEKSSGGISKDEFDSGLNVAPRGLQGALCLSLVCDAHVPHLLKLFLQHQVRRLEEDVEDVTTHVIGWKKDRITSLACVQVSACL